MRTFTSILALFLTFGLAAQLPHDPGHTHDRAIQFPDVPGYQTLVCDFHQHTVLSDGSVWPDIRIQEAMRDSLDAISLTEHLEYQPHSRDIPHPDRNRSYEIALKEAKAFNLIVVNGSEITRKMPPGHHNAIFIQDANKLLVNDSMEVFREANRQGAFVFWNHPNWVAQRKDGIARLEEMHLQLIREGLLHGIEVVNDLTYSDEALQIALDHNLTIMGTSDIHTLMDWQFKIPEGGHRPVTLVFAKERSEAAIKEALQNRRTVAWFNNTLIGREADLMPLLHASITVEKAWYNGTSSIAFIKLKNNSDAEFALLSSGAFTLHEHAGLVTLHPHSTTEIQVKTLQQLESFELGFAVLNAVTAPQVNVEMKLKVVVK